MLPQSVEPFLMSSKCSTWCIASLGRPSLKFSIVPPANHLNKSSHGHSEGGSQMSHFQGGPFRLQDVTGVTLPQLKSSNEQRPGPRAPSRAAAAPPNSWAPEHSESLRSNMKQPGIQPYKSSNLKCMFNGIMYGLLYGLYNPICKCRTLSKLYS